jgi:hypothetical protein
MKPMESSHDRLPASLLPAVLAYLVLTAPVQAQIVDLRSMKLPVWNLQADLRIRAPGLAPRFVVPAGLARDSEGRILVLDAGLPGLLVFDSAGGFLHQIGRRGEGAGAYTNPGEFGMIGDTIWLTDVRPARITLYRRQDGEYLESFSIGNPRPTRFTLVPFRMLGQDEFLLLAPPGPDLRGAPVGPLTYRQSLVRTNRAGSYADTLVSYTAEYPAIVTVAGGNGVFPYQPIRDGPYAGYSAMTRLVYEISRRVATADSAGEFRIILRRSPREIVHDRTFRYRPLPLPKPIVDSLTDEARARLASARPELAQVALRHLFLPAYQPPVAPDIDVTEDGYYIVAREAYPQGARQWLVLAADLEPAGVIELPPHALRIIGSATRTHVWVVERDERGLLQLVRYRRTP